MNLYPFPGVRFLGGEPNAGRGLRQHHLGQMPIQVLKLGLALKAKHYGIPSSSSPR